MNGSKAIRAKELCMIRRRDGFEHAILLVYLTLVIAVRIVQ